MSNVSFPGFRLKCLQDLKLKKRKKARQGQRYYAWFASESFTICFS